MFKTVLDSYVEGLYNEIMHSDDKGIKKELKKINKVFDEEHKREAFEKCFFPIITPRALLLNANVDLDEEDINTLIAQELIEFNAAIPMHISLYRVEVKLRGLEEHCNRTMLIPATCTLAEFCYAILAAFGVGEAHCFELLYKREIFKCKALCEEEPYVMSNIVLDMLDLRKGSKLQIVYDMGDFFQLDASIKEVVKLNRVSSTSDICVENTVGSNIWEDEHYFMDLYYTDSEEYNKCIHESGLESDYFDMYINDVPSKEDINEELLDVMFTLSLIHEDNVDNE